MGRTVGPDEPRAVEREDDVEVLDRDVVDDLIEGALEETSNRSRRRERTPASRAPRRTSRRAARRCRHRRTATVSRVWRMIEPGPVRHGGREPDDRSGVPWPARTIACPKTLVYDGAVSGFFGDMPVILSNGVTPWSSWTSFSAGSYPFPFLRDRVDQDRPVVLLDFLKILTSWAMLCPLIGPKYRNPSASKSMPGVMTTLIPSSTRAAIFRIRSPHDVELPGQVLHVRS